MSTLGQWQGQWLGDWQGANGPGDPGAMSGSATIRVTADADGVAVAWIGGAASVSMGAAGHLVDAAAQPAASGSAALLMRLAYARRLARQAAVSGEALMTMTAQGHLYAIDHGPRRRRELQFLEMLDELAVEDEFELTA